MTLQVMSVKSAIGINTSIERPCSGKHDRLNSTKDLFDLLLVRIHNCKEREMI